MRYRVVERKTYERSFIIEADTPEDVEEICRNEEYENDEPATYVGTEYIASEILRVRKEN